MAGRQCGRRPAFPRSQPMARAVAGVPGRSHVSRPSRRALIVVEITPKAEEIPAHSKVFLRERANYRANPVTPATARPEHGRKPSGTGSQGGDQDVVGRAVTHNEHMNQNGQWCFIASGVLAGRRGDKPVPETTGAGRPVDMEASGA